MTRNYLLSKIGSPLPKSKLIVEDQDAYDIMQRIIIKHKACASDYDRIASDFEAKDIYSVAERLWNFCKKNIRYDEEKIEKQNVSSPQTILHNGHCDCKGYALFIGGVLDALNRKGWNIKWKYRFASDDIFNETPGHVFIVITDQGQEIWVDPVLSEFNQDHWFPYYQDRKVNSTASIAGCGKAIGATTSQTGTVIMKLAPALATIPVVGWIASAAAEVIGGIVAIVGSKWNQSPDVRWLVQLYQYFALGDKSATSDNKINENYTQAAQAYFSVVTGVPIGGRKDLNILQSGDGNTNTPTGQAPAQRAANYLAFKNLQNSISLDQATAAAAIAGALNFSAPAGGWASLTAAPSTIDNSLTAPSLFVGSNGILTTAAGLPAALSNNNTILFAAAAAIALILFIK